MLHWSCEQSVCCPALLDNLADFSVIFTLILTKHARSFRIGRWVSIWITEQWLQQEGAFQFRNMTAPHAFIGKSGKRLDWCTASIDDYVEINQHMMHVNADWIKVTHGLMAMMLATNWFKELNLKFQPIYNILLHVNADWIKVPHG